MGGYVYWDEHPQLDPAELHRLAFEVMTERQVASWATRPNCILRGEPTPAASEDRIRGSMLFPVPAEVL